MAAKKKRSYARAAAPRRYYGPKKKSRRTKSGTAQIPAAGVTVGLVVANKDPLMYAVNNMSIEGGKTAVKAMLQPEQIKKDVIYGGVGLVAGAAVKKFAPRFIKAPLGKLAKKIPKVI